MSTFDLLANSIHPILSLDGVLTAFSNVDVRIQDTPPEIANLGDIWYDPTRNKRYIYTAGGWVEDDAPVGGVPNYTYYGETPPNNPHTGDYWYQPSTNILYQWTGDEWVAVGGVLVSASTSIQFDYSQLTALATKVLNLPYSGIAPLHNTLTLLYSQLLVVNDTLQLPYYEQSAGITFTTTFNYTITNSRRRFKLVKELDIEYAIPIKTVVVSTTLFNYADATPILNNLILSYSDVTPLINNLVLSYSNAIPLLSTLASSWNHTTDVMLNTKFNYGISAKQYIDLHTNFGYSILNTSIQNIDSSPVLLKDGEPIDFITINLSSDENSPFWIGDVSLANIEDFVKFNVQDAVQVVFNDATFNMIVDGKNLSRGDNAAQACQLSLISPLALLDSPFASSINMSYATSTYASKVVEDQLGEIDWVIPDWLVPPEQLQFTNTTPLAIARSIIEAIGGLIESAPDGSATIRKTYPVDVPDYPQGNFVPLTDSDLFAVQESIAPQKIVNKLDLYTQELGAIRDTLEYEANEGSSTSGIIYAYPSPNRPITLTHTGAPNVGIAPVGVNVRVETETIEFIKGAATTRYPINGIVSMNWHYTNLGAVKYSGNNLTSSVAGESLLVIKYNVEAYRFNVSGTDVTQFLTNG